MDEITKGMIFGAILMLAAIGFGTIVTMTIVSPSWTDIKAKVVMYESFKDMNSREVAEKKCLQKLEQGGYALDEMELTYYDGNAYVKMVGVAKDSK